MARRRPAAVARSNAAVHRLEPDDLTELLIEANVPIGERADCARYIDERFDFYDRRLAHSNAFSEASQAESLRRVGDAAKELSEALASLPPALRLAVEPDYQAFVRKGFARHIAMVTARA